MDMESDTAMYIKTNQKFANFYNKLGSSVLLDDYKSEYDGLEFTSRMYKDIVVTDDITVIASTSTLKIIYNVEIVTSSINDVLRDVADEEHTYFEGAEAVYCLTPISVSYGGVAIDTLQTNMYVKDELRVHSSFDSSDVFKLNREKIVFVPEDSSFKLIALEYEIDNNKHLMFGYESDDGSRHFPPYLNHPIVDSTFDIDSVTLAVNEYNEKVFIIKVDSGSNSYTVHVSAMKLDGFGIGGYNLAGLDSKWLIQNDFILSNGVSVTWLSDSDRNLSTTLNSDVWLLDDYPILAFGNSDKPLNPPFTDFPTNPSPGATTAYQIITYNKVINWEGGYLFDREFKQCTDLGVDDGDKKCIHNQDIRREYSVTPPFVRSTDVSIAYGNSGYGFVKRDRQFFVNSFGRTKSIYLPSYRSQGHIEHKSSINMYEEAIPLPVIFPMLMAMKNTDDHPMITYYSGGNDQRFKADRTTSNAYDSSES
jgi:hypothetical protein